MEFFETYPKYNQPEAYFILFLIALYRVAFVIFSLVFAKRSFASVIHGNLHYRAGKVLDKLDNLKKKNTNQKKL